MDPIISIIIPTYKRPALLRRAVESSLRAAKHHEIEILVSDNSPDDLSEKALKTFKDSRLQYWKNESNLGSEGNLSKLLRKASGRWVFFLTDDDYLYSNSMELMLAIMNKYPEVGVMLSGYDAQKETGEFQFTFQYSQNTGFFKPSIETLTSFVMASHILSGIMIRRDAIDIDGFEHFFGSMYPQVYLVGNALKSYPLYYFSEVFRSHTVFNEIFWEYHDDYMTGSFIDIFTYLTESNDWRPARSILFKKVIDNNFVNRAPSLLKNSFEEFHNYMKSTVKNKSLVDSRYFWQSTLNFLPRIHQLYPNINLNEFLQELLNTIEATHGIQASTNSFQILSELSGNRV